MELSFGKMIRGNKQLITLPYEHLVVLNAHIYSKKYK